MKSNILNASHPFDELAKTYDKVFTNTEIGELLRSRTHEQMTLIFKPGSSVLEINCGTGEDAAFLAQHGVQVIATDESVEMIKYSQRKINRLGLTDKVILRQCYFEELDSILGPEQTFHGIVSNFGGLNCVEDIESLSMKLAHRVKPDGYIFLCIMGRWSPWEWFYLGCKGKFRRILERIRGETEWRGQTIRYFTPGQIIKCFAPYCEVSKVSGLGYLLPPTYIGSFVSMHPTLFRWLNSLERKFESVPGIPYLSDHFMLILTRK